MNIIYCVTILLIPVEQVAESSAQSTDTPSRRSANGNISSGSSTRNSFGLSTLVLISEKQSNVKVYLRTQWTKNYINFPIMNYCMSEGAGCYKNARNEKNGNVDKKDDVEVWQKPQMFQYNNYSLTFLPPFIFYLSFTACVKSRGAGAATWAETLLHLQLPILLQRGNLSGDAVLAGICFDSRAASRVSGQTRAALTAWGVQVQVITDVRLSVTLFFYGGIDDSKSIICLFQM